MIAPLDGLFEIVWGLLILGDLLTRLAAVPMIVNMLGALLITSCRPCGATPLVPPASPMPAPSPRTRRRYATDQGASSPRISRASSARALRSSARACFPASVAV
ncbi:DoxX family protein [Streptomyces bacillaris]